MKDFDHDGKTIEESCGITQSEIEYYKDIMIKDLVSTHRLSEVVERIEKRIKDGDDIFIRVFVLERVFELIRDMEWKVSQESKQKNGE
ncbi:MAG TPA: hypothetical protein PKW14_08300 [Bacteroidota bacterium]|nr:hypothetical protein [Bacteroidota bacterium]